MGGRRSVPSGDVLEAGIERAARKLSLLMFKTWGDSEAELWDEDRLGDDGKQEARDAVRMVLHETGFVR